MKNKGPLSFLFVSFIAGLVFALGLGVSGMTNPENVIGFLRVGSDWNPSLLWVMGGAIPVYALASWLSKKMKRPVAACDWTELPRTGFDIPRKVLAGNVLFGFGWGLSGYCPGPAIVSTVSLAPQALTFTAFMFLGFALWEFWLKKVRLLQG